MFPEKKSLFGEGSHEKNVSTLAWRKSLADCFSFVDIIWGVHSGVVSCKGMKMLENMLVIWMLEIKILIIGKFITDYRLQLSVFRKLKFEAGTFEFLKIFSCSLYRLRISVNKLIFGYSQILSVFHFS